MRKFLITLLFLPILVQATAIYPIPETAWQRCHLNVFCYFKPSFGTTVTTINGTDTLSNSRTVINTNFSNLNAGKIENSSSSIAAITTLSNLVTVGTIGSGVWNGTAVTGAFGGTSSTTLSSNQVLLGNTTNGIKVVNGYGTSGQFLTSGGSGSAPTWTTSALDNSLNYNWTGTDLFKNLNASSTAANPIVLNTVSYDTPSTQGTASSTLVNDGSGHLSWNPLSRLIATTTSYNYNSINSTTTLISKVLAGGSLGRGNVIEYKLPITDSTQSSGNALVFELGYGNASSTMVMKNAGADGALCANTGGGNMQPIVYMSIQLYANGATGTQTMSSRVTCEGTPSSTFTPTVTWAANFSIDSTANQSLVLTVRTTGNGGNDRFVADRAIMKLDTL